MAVGTSIEWTDSTWNPVTGCSKVSAGCRHCYAERMANRLKSMRNINYRNGFNVAIHKHTFEYPLKWKNPRMIFVNSMSDLFHQSVSKTDIYRIFDVMNRAHWHTYQILTKRSERLLAVDPYLQWGPQIWMGVSIENAKYLWRLDHLRQTHASVKFLSLEPLLGPLPNLELRGIDWVIVGGESGPKARSMDLAWATEIRDQCLDHKVPFFFKQWGGFNKKKSGRLLEGKTWDQMPTVFVSSP